MKIGERIGAISRDEDGTIRLLGFGVYEDNQPLMFSDANGRLIIIPTPLLRLDNGRTVRGRECRWGPEEEMRACISELPVVYVDTASS